MNQETVVMCVVALILGMLLSHMLKDVCGCNKVVEGCSRSGLMCNSNSDCCSGKCHGGWSGNGIRKKCG